MKKAHCGPASQKKPVGGPNLTNIPAQTQFPPQRLPANEIRVPYQSSAPSGAGLALGSGKSSVAATAT